MDQYPELPIREQFAPYGLDHYLVILDYAKINENEFHDICDKFTNKEIFEINSDGSIKKDNENNPILKNVCRRQSGPDVQGS